MHLEVKAPNNVKKSFIFIFIFILSFFVAGLIAYQITYSPMIILTLLFGAPIFFLVINEKTKNTGLFALMGLAPFLGIVKAYTGVRYAPLIFDLALIVMVISPILNKVISHKKFTTLEKLVLMFLAISVVEMFNPNIPNLKVGLEGLRAISFQSIGLFAGALLINSKKQIKQIGIILCVVATLVAIYGIKQFFSPSALDLKIITMTGSAASTYTSLGQLRAFSTMSGPFHLGLFMAVMILLMVAFLYFKKNRGILFTLMILYIFTLILTITRGNWIGLIAGLVIIVILNILKQQTIITAMSKIIISSFILVISIWGLYYFVHLMSYQLGSGIIEKRFISLSQLLDEKHVEMRVESWQDTVIPAIIRQPLGYGTSSALDSFSHRADFNSRKLFSSHSQYLKVAIELGIPGFVIFILIMIKSLNLAIKTYFKIKDAFLKSVVVWICGFFILIYVSGIVAPMLDVYPVNLYFWFCLGLLIKLKDIDSYELMHR